ncbi:MAG: DUF3604 domain-containing protein [Parahaliea sp.]
MTKYISHASLLAAGLLVASSLARAEGGVYSPYADETLPRQLLWGDTHLHTDLSTDAFGYGAKLGPETAYRFASGEVVSTTYGLKVRLRRPLDFLVLADHAEALGMMQRLVGGDAALMANAKAAEWHRLSKSSAPEDQATFKQLFSDGAKRRDLFNTLTSLSTPALQKNIWNDAIAIGEGFNQPGKFTVLLGYEWTSAIKGSNLHRVVVYRDGADEVGQLAPFSQSMSSDPRDLWTFLTGYEEQTGGQVLAIPHNGNLSNGIMFPVETTAFGAAVDGDYATRRQRWEPLYEITQMKGDGETHPLLSPDDEFADYETWDSGNFFGIPKTEAMLPHEYARSALRHGLEIQRREGVNPYQFGLIGSTDSHTGLSTAEEDNFFGKHSLTEPGPERWQTPLGKSKDWEVLGWEAAAAGRAAVWATQNSREAVWDALKRREVYATTGPRIAVRLFAGWQFQAEDAQRPDLAVHGYQAGVPMGAVLKRTSDKRGKAAAPTLLLAASRDPEGANLDRIQVIKGWVDSQGQTHERVYDAVWSDAAKRRPGADGKLPSIGNTVDIATASYRNSIGAAELATVWVDPDFDPEQAAFYYARVLEIPTPRWTAYEAARYGVSMSADVPMVTTERAYTSPVWYQP